MRPAIDLIDGTDLCDLLKNLRLGITTETVEVPKVNASFFTGVVDLYGCPMRTDTAIQRTPPVTPYLRCCRRDAACWRLSDKDNQ